MQYIKEAFDANWVAPLGKNVDEFEKEVASLVGAKDAAALSAGTAALHLALKAAGVGLGDLVFCPTLTFSATVNPILYLGAVPVFIDSDFDTWNMSPGALKKAFETYTNVKAVIVVHLYGMCANLKEIMSICKEYHVSLIEDAAESLGSRYQNQWTGSFGDYGIFSFNGNKIITTSGGGMVVCNLQSEEAAKERIRKVRFWATQARENVRYYQHKEIGYNYRMSNIVAGIGRGQLNVLNNRIEKKRYIYQTYKNILHDLEWIRFMPMLEQTYSNCWLTCIQVDENKRNIGPNEIMKALESDDIESRPIWKPMHLQPVFSQMDFVTEVKAALRTIDMESGADNSVAGTLFQKGVCLPSDTKMEVQDIERVCNVIHRLWE